MWSSSAILDETHHPDFAIGEIAVASAISPQQCGAKSHHLIAGADHPRRLKAAFDQVAVEIDVRSNVMSDGTCVVTETNATVKGRGAKPNRPSFLTILQHHPEPNVVPLICASSNRLFKGKVFAAACVEQGG